MSHIDIPLSCRIPLTIKCVANKSSMQSILKKAYPPNSQNYLKIRLDPFLPPDWKKTYSIINK